MTPQEIAAILGLSVNRSQGAPCEWWYRILFNSCADMYAFVELCAEACGKRVTPTAFMSGQGVAEWWDHD